MGAELLTIPDCPHAAAAKDLFERALSLAGSSGGLVLIVVDSEEEAASLGFRGSPTFRLDGRDLFPVLGGPALSCRIYRTTDGAGSLPDLKSLRTAVEERLNGNALRGG